MNGSYGRVMRMILRSALFGVLVAILGVPAAGAQTFGIMESAEVIQPGNFKLAAYPMFVLGDDGADDELGVVVRGGYGFSNRLDAELGAAFFDGLTLLGGNVELALIRPLPAATAASFALAVRGGAHLVQGEVEDALGLDLAALGSTHLTDRLELVGAVQYNRTFLDDPVEDLATVHLVPGIEFRIAQTLDLLAEFGLGLDEDAANYLSAGLAFYLR
jgi:hypothetical protein